MARGSLLRALALLASVGSVLVSFGMLWVITVEWSRVNGDRIPFWSVVMVGFFAYGALSSYAIQHERAPSWIRTMLVGGSVAALLVGTAAVVENEFRAVRTGDWEGHVSLMGIVLAGHGALMLAHLLERWVLKARAA